MICTFGDKQDVRWWMDHKLPLRQAIDRNGRLTDIAGAYASLPTDEAKRAIIQDMKNQGIVNKQEPLEQNVGLCWRCKTPIEILSERQWFVKLNPEEIKAVSHEIQWVPPYMETRLVNWADSVEWDWCISRQRIFATPIPVWYCKKCGEPLVAKEEWLPLDPTRTQPLISCKCGSQLVHPRGGCPGHLGWDSSISSPGSFGMARQSRCQIPDPASAPGSRHHKDMGLLHHRQGQGLSWK